MIIREEHKGKLLANQLLD